MTHCLSQKDVRDVLVKIKELPEALVVKQRFEEAWSKREKELDRLRRMKPEILNVLRKYDIDCIYVYGSCARGEERPRSHINLLIKSNIGSLFKLLELQEELTELLSKKVDLTTEETIRLNKLEKNILSDLIEL